jgi:Cdc6-like AAA superfamily ATPase
MVDKEIILKRINILEPIYKRINSLQDGYRQNIALLGQNGVGKSTILKYLSTSFKRPQLTFAYVNLEGCSDFESFITRLLGNMFYNYLSEKGLIMKDDFNYLAKAIEQFLPNTAQNVSLIRQLIEKNRFNEAFQKTLDCTDIFTKESGHKLVLIIDEFDTLEDLGFKNAFSILGKKIMLQKFIAFIVASSRPQKAQRILSEKLSLLFGNFEIIPALPLEHATSKEFIANILAPFLIPGLYSDFLVNLTLGFPFYLKVISKELSRMAEQSAANEIDASMVTQALYNICCKETGFLNEKFSNTIERVCRTKNEAGKNTLKENLAIIISLAEGLKTVNSITQASRKARPTVNARMIKFIEQGIVTKNGSFLKIADPLFELWLQSVYSKRINRINENDIEFKNQFIDAMSRRIEDFRFESGRKYLDRIHEVFQLFQDEAIMLNRRKIKLPRFEEIKPLAFENSGIKEGLLGRNANTVWITGLKPQRLIESDVGEFIQECKKIKHKRLTKVLIAFGEVELNASLLAKEEKIQTWDLTQLNSLLQLFGKPRIMEATYENNDYR